MILIVVKIIFDQSYIVEVNVKIAPFHNKISVFVCLRLFLYCLLKTFVIRGILSIKTVIGCKNAVAVPKVVKISPY